MRHIYTNCKQNKYLFFLRSFLIIPTLFFLSETYAQTCLIDNSTAWSGSYNTTPGYCSSSYKYSLNNSFYKDLTIPSSTASFKFTFKFGTHGYSSNSSYVQIEAPIGTVVATYDAAAGDNVDTNGGCLQARTLSANNPVGNTTIRITVYGDDNYAKIEPTCFSICNLSATVNVTQPSCGQTTGSIVVTSPSGATTYQYKNGSGGTWQSGNSFSGLVPADYNIYIRDASNTTCEKLLGTYTVNTPPTIPTASITGSNNLTCATTSVTRTATGGSTYLWSNSLGTTATVNITTAGTYTVTVTAVNGCSATATTSVTSDTTPPTANITGSNNLTCATNSVSRTATGGGTYVWSNSLGTTATVNISAAGTYTVTITSANGCSATATTIVTVDNAVPTANITGSNNLTCATTSVTRTASGGGIYLWSNSLGTNATANITTAGTYTVTVTSTNGCTATATTLVTIDNAVPTANINGNENITCSVGSVTRTASGGGSGTPPAYLWSNALGTNASVNITTAGTYTVTVTLANGCSATATTLVTIDNAVPTASITGSNNLTCATNSVSRTATGGGTYIWSNSLGTNATANITTAGTYTVTITSANGCSATATTSVTSNTTPPTASITGSENITCSVGSVTRTATGGGTYLWSNALGTNASVTISSGGTYTVTITNTSGCTATATTVILQDNSVPPADAGIDKTLTCTSPSTTISVPAILGNTYAWSPTTALSSAIVSNPTASPNVTTTYTLTVTNTATGCTATDAVIVTANKTVPTVNISLSEDTLTCIIKQTTLTANVSPAGNYTYQWSNGGIASSTTLYSSGTITLAVTAANGCIATATTVITNNIIPPTAVITGTNNLTCTTSSVTRTASGGGSYLWSNNLGTNALVNITSAGTYTVTVTSVNGCTASATTTVIADTGIPIVTIVPTDDTLTCTKTQAVLTATPSQAGTYTYLWSNNTTFSTITVYDAGTYSVQVTAANGCKASASIVIVEFNAVTAQVDVTPVLCKGGNSGKITVTGFDGIPPYQFKLNSGSFQSSNVFGNLVTGSYAVTIKDAGGCTASVNVMVNEPIAPLSIAATPTNLKCFGGNDGKITAGATGGTPTYQFSINGGTPQSSNIFSSLVAGTYIVSVIDGHECIATTTATLTQPTKVTVTATGSMIDCSTPKGTISTSATGGTPTYQFAIDGTTFQPSGSFTNLNGGTYTITVKDVNLCIGTITAAITVADTVKPTFNATATMVTCTAGTANNDGKLSISNIVNGVKYQYSAGVTFNAGTATPAVATTIPPTGILTNSLSNPMGNSQKYTIRVYNNNDCFKDVTVELMKRVCACKEDICIPYKIAKTKSR